MELQTFTITQVEQILLSTPEGRAVIAARQLVEERATLIKEIAEEQERWQEVVPPLKLEVEKAEAAVKAAQAELDKAKAELSQRKSLYGLANVRSQHQVEKKRMALVRTASPAIGAFIGECQNLWHEERANEGQEFVVLTRDPEEKEQLRQAAIAKQAEKLARMEAVVNARKAAEDLRFLAISEDEVLQRLDALRSILPQKKEQYPGGPVNIELARASLQARENLRMRRM